MERRTGAVAALGLALATASIGAGCAPAQQPAGRRTVAAIEVPLITINDGADLLAILRREAGQGGLHVDDDRQQWINFRKSAPPEEAPFAESILNNTIYVGVWRGANDDDPELFVDDGGHQGRPWLTFLRGKHPGLATTDCVRLLVEIKERWPDARVVPVIPNGALPLSSDLTWTGAAYVVKAERASAYAAPGKQNPT